MRTLQTSQIILRAHYLKLVELLDSAAQKIAPVRKKVRFCAAKLLEYFRYWCNWVRQHEQRDWYYRKLKQIYDDLMGEHSLHIIRAAIALLDEKGLLRRSNNFNGQDKVYRYQVNNERLEQLLLKKNLQDADLNSENSSGESQTVNPSNQSSNNFSARQTENESQPLEPATESFVSKQAVSEVFSGIKLPSKAKSDFKRPKPKTSLCDKSSEAGGVRTSSDTLAASAASEVEPWEIAPFQPYPYFLQWRALHYKNQGGHWANSPQSNAYAEFYKNRFKTAILWQEFLQFYNLALDNALVLQAAGIEVKLPTCFEDHDVVSDRVVARKAETLVQNTAQPKSVIPPAADFTAKMNQLVIQHALHGRQGGEGTSPQRPTKPKPELPTPKDSLQMYLDWLHGDEPVLVAEARKKLNRMVMERDDLLPHWDDGGQLIDVEIVED